MMTKSCACGSVCQDARDNRAIATRGRTLRTHLHRARPILFLALFAMLATGLVAQDSPHVATVAPEMGKVNDMVTLSGNNLGKEGVAAAFLSDDTMDYKAAIMEQAADKIVLKVPEVKPGRYNVSIQVAGKIIISPLHFTVQ